MDSPYVVGTPFDGGRLAVGDGHEIAYWQYGNPQGKAAVYLHGGPGAGSDSAVVALFNPAAYRVVLFDQRGCGDSTPHAELNCNSTWDLVADMEKLREHLHIPRWLVCGGSWGSALGLAYAQTHPQFVTELILRGIFALRQEELFWFYQQGADRVFPDFWEDYIAPIPVAERGDMLAAYHRRLTGEDEKTQLACARAWTLWEGRTLSLQRDLQREEKFADEKFALAFARIENHYFVNRGFFAQDGQLINDAHKLNDIPGTIIHGRYDMVTPVKNAWDLHKQWTSAKLVIVENAGHAVSEPGITAAIIAATDNYADN